MKSIVHFFKFVCISQILLISCKSGTINEESHSLTSPDSLKNAIYKAHYVDSVLKYNWISCRMTITNSNNNIEEEFFLASSTHANELIFKKDSINIGERQRNENIPQHIKDQAALWQYYLLAPYKLSESDKIWSIDTFHTLHEEEWLCAHYHHSKNPQDIYYVFIDPRHYIIKAIGLDSKNDKNDFIVLYEAYTMESSGLFPNRWLVYKWNISDGLQEKIGEVEIYSYRLSDYENVLNLSSKF